MVFSSILFIFLFLPISILLTLIVPGKFRNILLIILSSVFYFWGEKFLISIVYLSIFINYISGLLLAWDDRKEKLKPQALSFRKAVLVCSIVGNLAILGYYKYFNFLVENLQKFLTDIGSNTAIFESIPHVILPLGVSFFTFQALSYTIDVYRREVKATKNLFDLACYITMFPQLVAGPIVRYKDIERQLKNPRIKAEEFYQGIQLFILGLSQKLLIANTVAKTADTIFSMPAESLSAPLAWSGALSYALQIYFDFSGYSNMAIGIGLMLGFRFPENFNYPYISQSIQEFWRRWHISLSTWFRDYLYIPLGGNRKSPIRTYINLLIVFLLCGLWHGGQWTFVLWGLYHGLFLALEKKGIKRLLDQIAPPLRYLYSIPVILVGWVLFRTESLNQCIIYLTAMAGQNQELTQPHHPILLYLRNDVLLAWAFGIFFSTPCLKNLITAVRKRSGETFTRSKFLIFETCRMGVLTILLIFCLANLSSSAYNPFLYFRF